MQNLQAILSAAGMNFSGCKDNYLLSDKNLFAAEWSIWFLFSGRLSCKGNGCCKGTAKNVNVEISMIAGGIEWTKAAFDWSQRVPQSIREHRAKSLRPYRAPRSLPLICRSQQQHINRISRPRPQTHPKIWGAIRRRARLPMFHASRWSWRTPAKTLTTAAVQRWGGINRRIWPRNGVDENLKE